MDGNGRWAERRSHCRTWGHIRGSSVVSEIVEEADSLGINALTLYSFSTENWGRPTKEVSTLFKLLKKFLLRERQRVIKNNIRFKVMGDYQDLPSQTIQIICDLEEVTENNKGLKLTIAFGYGGRSELVSSVNNWIASNPGKMISQKNINNLLLVPDLGDVDLLIRTGGDQRISNFLLWQIAYAELWFTKTSWPNFTKDEFRGIVNKAIGRERRFGTVDANTSLDHSVGLAKKNKNIFLENREGINNE